MGAMSIVQPSSQRLTPSLSISARLPKTPCAAIHMSPSREPASGFSVPGRTSRSFHLKTCASATDGAPVAPPTPPEAPPVNTDIQTVQLDGNIKLFQCFCNSHLRYEAEYGRKRGTTTNSYMVIDGDEAMLIDVPRQAYLETFCNQLSKEKIGVSKLVITHLTPDVAETLTEVLRVIKRAPGGLELILTKPAEKVLSAKLGDELEATLEGVTLQIVKGQEEIQIGRRTFQCLPSTTPRYPDLMCLYERNTRRLFSSCFFSSHANPQRGELGTDGTDRGGWAVYGSDWQFFFDCMFAPVVRQAETAIDKLDLSVAAGSAGAPSLLLQLKKLLGGSARTPAGSRPVALILPRHGPLVRQSVSQLVNSYNNTVITKGTCSWIEDQKTKLQSAKVAVLYASAYGNTASLAQAISRGITKAGVGVEMVNLEQVSTSEAEEVLLSSQGFCIGSPTLGGHMPTQVSAMLGNILRLEAAKALPCGAYGSFGWSGEAVDILHGRLKDSGFPIAFKPIKIQFRPDAKAIQVCEESGTDLAQGILKAKKKQQMQTERRTTSLQSANTSGAAMAMGRVVGSLSVVTCKDGDAESAMLASWLSQASFDPPGLTVAVKRDRATESLMVNGNNFNVNILKEGAEGPLIRAMMKKFGPGEDRFSDVKHTRSEETGCVVLDDAVSVLECTVTDRMDAGDHFLVYGTVKDGAVLDSSAVSAVHHRKTGTSY